MHNNYRDNKEAGPVFSSYLFNNLHQVEQQDFKSRGDGNHLSEKEKYSHALNGMRRMPAETEISSRITEMVREIRALKIEKKAVVLAHYYMSPELQILASQGGVADFTGDSLGLSQAASTVSAERIIFCGVRFMAETAKILNPEKAVLHPSNLAGCSLAASITAADVRKLKKQNPGAPVIAYINTNAETKAESDICCTSRNAVAIAQSLPEQQIIFIPDQFMGRNLGTQIFRETGKELILWSGSCEVHEKFTAEKIGALSEEYPEAEILLHWEVPDSTVEQAFPAKRGIVGSTNEIISYAGKSNAKQFILGSECDLGATLRGMFKEKEFITPCVYCSYMKKITLENTLAALRAAGTLEEKKYQVELSEDILRRARIPIERMFAVM